MQFLTTAAFLIIQNSNKMKTTAMFIALCMGLLLSCAEQEIEPKKPQHEQYIGTWGNIDTETGTISRVNITVDNASQASIHVWSYCGNDECDWGRLDVDPDLLQASKFRIVWNSTENTTIQQFEYISGALRVLTTIQTKGNEGRPGLTSEDFFELQ